MSRFYRAYMAGSGDMRPDMPCMGGEENAPCPAPENGSLPLAMAYVPSQTFRNLYAPAEGWRRGTIFAELDKPYEGGCCK